MPSCGRSGVSKLAGSGADGRLRSDRRSRFVSAEHDADDVIAERVICRGEPSPVTFHRSAFNLIFVCNDVALFLT